MRIARGLESAFKGLGGAHPLTWGDCKVCRNMV